MSAPPFRHIGGTVVSDGGPIGLAAALRLVRLYALEALACETNGERRGAVARARRALALHEAAAQAARWRRAAGWADPAEADLIR